MMRLTHFEAGYTFTCLYDLNDIVVGNEVKVTGHRLYKATPGKGNIPLVIELEDQQVVGERVTFTVTPRNPGLIFLQLSRTAQLTMLAKRCPLLALVWICVTMSF